MTVLVTGANGQLGRSVCERLSAVDRAHVALDSRQLDIGDDAAVAAQIKTAQYSAIINCAAYTAVDRAESEPAAAYRVNRDGAGNLAAAAKQAGIPLLHVSTDYVFDGSKQGAYTPQDITRPLGVYGASKLAGEQAIAASGCRYLIVRTAWVFSEHGNNFVKTMLRLGAERDQLSVVADQFGSPTYAGDLAAVLVAAAEKMSESGCAELDNQIYHYGGTPSCSWHQLAQSLFAEAVASGLLARAPQLTPISTAEYPTAAARPANSVLDSGAVAEALGLPASNWQSVLAHCSARIIGAGQ
ncbi:dTDP-4-dehydrorhamnose reductase [Gammaproteobacteria bacterium LSUCC0057]|uniref:dTDP-4-dehydrorhamnose reductase n=1 Tax=Gammaproteobacteria bacterium LSUCC0057 TaxID=2559237 RepID=A0A4Y8UJU7_9GAMM|nr:dTDP-4-dehydrorhamnose reductase [Gammaproteobacteria bacterium LSUCC0057]